MYLITKATVSIVLCLLVHISTVCRGVEALEMHVFLLRHAESEFNAGNEDLYDAPLTDRGKEQAANLTGHYDKEICSPLTRTKQTLHLSKVIYKAFLTRGCRGMQVLFCWGGGGVL